MSDEHQLSHVDGAGRPTMVDVGSKEITRRSAAAEAYVELPEVVYAALSEGDGRTKKGPVFDTAIIAGVMAAKKTHELIPFCHPLALDNCKVHVDLDAERRAAHVRCEVGVSGRTGVEMEALTGASVAALTIYDMCKALSHDMVVGDVRLMAKQGGKRDFARQGAGKTEAGVG